MFIISFNSHYNYQMWAKLYPFYSYEDTNRTVKEATRHPFGKKIPGQILKLISWSTLAHKGVGENLLRIWPLPHFQG